MPEPGGSRNRRDRRERPEQRKIILAKKEDPTPAEAAQPKLLLKPKEPAEIARPPPREKPEEQQKPKDVVEEALMQMTKPLALLTGELMLNVETFASYVQEMSTQFTVFGFIGLQNVGKSTLANVLLNPESSLESVLDGQVFATRGARHRLKIEPITEGIDLYITEDRLFVLDCGPFLTNQLHKEGILNELDELKVLILLLNICHTLVVVENNYLNPNLWRMLHCADMMKTSLKDVGPDHSAMLMFVKNRAARDEPLDRMQKIYRNIFRTSDLNISYKHAEEAVNYLTFPDLSDFSGDRISDVDKLRQHVLSFRRRALMTKNHNFASQIPNFNEKLWLQMVAKAWDANSNNYFLKKYLNLKEKFNLLNHVSINEHSKERNIYYPDE